MGIKIAITDFYTYATSEFSILSQFESQFIDHSQQHASQELDIYGVLLESCFLAHAFLLFERQYSSLIYATCFLPYIYSFFAQNLSHSINFHLLLCSYLRHSHIVKYSIGYVSYIRHYLDDISCKKKSLDI